MNICKICNREYKYNKRKGHTKELCNSCRSNINQRIKKEKLVALHGGKCCKCNYNKCIHALDFHHINPSTKEFAIGGGYNRAWTSLVEESNKCILVCRNCHSEIHHGVDSEYHEYRIRKNKKLEVERQLRKYKKELRSIKERACIQCSTNFKPPADSHRFCSVKCANKSNRKVEHPSKELLQKLVWEKPTSQLAEDFKVSDKAIEKWCKKYDIEKPGRGYWAKKRSKK